MDELNIKLINLVESEPCIYDKTDVFYSNKDYVKHVWERISNEVQLSVPVCQKRWRYLRDYFVRQLHMSKNDNKKSYWALFDRMLFLAPFSTRKTRVTHPSFAAVRNSGSISSKKRRTSTFLKQHWENEQNTNVLSVSSSSSNTGIDEFNSYDYLNLYQAQFGFADNIALLQLHKQKSSQPYLVDEMSSLPLEIQIRSSSSEPNNNSLSNSRQTSTSVSNFKIVPSTKKVSQDKKDLIGSNFVSTSTNYMEHLNKNDLRMQNYNRRSTNPLASTLTDISTNYQSSPLLAVETHYSNSEKSPNIFPSNDEEKFHHTKVNRAENKKIRNSISSDVVICPEDLSKPELKANSTRKFKRQSTKKTKESEILKELLNILKKTESPNCDEHDFFFRSLLNSVRKIDEQLIIPFRTEILRTVMKFKEMSNSTNKNINNNFEISNEQTALNNDNTNFNYQSLNAISTSVRSLEDDDDIVIIDTGETNWRQKLKSY